MRMTRARYVTICQQLLVTAVVLGVGLSAAGVMTLQIVAPGGEVPGATGRPATASDLAPAITISDAFVDKAPVTPEVRSVKVTGIDPQAARDIPGTVTAPDTSARQSAPKQDRPAKLAALSEPTPVKGYATVGVTWKAGTPLEEDEISVQVRTRTGSTWSEWTAAEYHDEHSPDPDSAEARKVRPGTDAVVVGNVDEVQMRADTVDGTVPEDLELAVVDPGAGQVTKEPAAIDTADLPQSAEEAGGPDGSAGAVQDATTEDGLALMAMTVTAKPTIYSRAQWGANEALRDKGSLSYGTIKTGFIHHTVNANDYSASQVPALIRGIYAYHTQSRGWSDIGYNFLVDRFGRIWEGRYGGVGRAVVGAHTLGYNEYSFAMSAIGNFDITAPPKAVLDAYASLYAWKLSKKDIPADATRLWVKDRYLAAINGHRDTGKTACPGRYLYAQLPAVRAAARAIQNGSQAPVAPVDPVTLDPIAAPVGVPSPTQAPLEAGTQSSFAFPPRTSLTGSGWPDVLAASTTGRVSVLPTEGILDYTTATVNPGNWNAMRIIAAVGDVTGDGRSDVLATKRKSGVTKVFPGDGRGYVGRPVAKTRAFARMKTVVGARDFDRDGKLDVIGHQRKTNALLLFRGKGGGKFRSPIVLHRSWPFTKTAAVGKFDAGKQPDLVGVKDGNRLYLIPGASRGTALGKPVRLAVLPAKADALLGWGDLNQDGPSDVMVRAGGVTTLYSGVRAPRLGQSQGPFLRLAGLARLSLAPMVGSGAADAVGRNAAGQLVVVANNGMRNTSAPITSNLTVAGATQLLSVGDWDRDGKADVVVRTADLDTLVLYPGLGNGSFGRPRSLGSGWKTITRLAAVGDVTGDGYPDLLGRTPTGPMTLFRGAGNDAFKAPKLPPASMRTYNQIGSAAWSPTGSVLASADGTFVPLTGTDTGSALRMANGSVAPAYDSFVGVGDTNGDGVADVLARESGTGTIWLLPGKTSGGFAPRMWVATGFAGYRLVG